jgi:hypothetical protein
MYTGKFMNIIWEAAGRPSHKFTATVYQGACATCGHDIKSEAVAVSSLAGDAFGRQVSFINGDHVCIACAWMYSFPKETHRNVFVVANKLYWPMIGVESATEERPSWQKLLLSTQQLPQDTPAIGVLTTDPKPRLWPMTHEVTLNNFGLYLHSPDYDVSEFRFFDLNSCITTIQLLNKILLLGYSKRACATSLLKETKKIEKLGGIVFELEQNLQSLRSTPHFIPSLLVAGQKK